jgi:hypothetical protein
MWHRSRAQVEWERSKRDIERRHPRPAPPASAAPMSEHHLRAHVEGLKAFDQQERGSSMRRLAWENSIGGNVERLRRQLDEQAATRAAEIADAERRLEELRRAAQ